MSAKITRELTRNQIKKAGNNLRDDKLTAIDNEIINSFRGMHEPLMVLLISTIKRKKIKPQIIARRLKRLSSIDKKLKKFKDMNLARLQDVAGIRTIFKNMNEVNIFAKEMENSYTSSNSSFSLVRINDYIENPKDDGYRGIHQIYKYQKARYDYAVGLNVELQIRTLLQHYWATAVEVLGLKTSSNLKLGIGEDHYKEFFKLSSVLFSYKEKMPYIEQYKNISIEDISKKLLKLDTEYNIFNTLNALSITSKNINDNSKGKHEYYVIKLDLNKSTLSLYGFKDIEEAKDWYSFLENKANTDNTDTVLVSVSDVKKLKKAYPNYYLDSDNFIKSIKSIIENIK